MRRYFVAVFAALLVVIGLSVVSVGTATAATPLPSRLEDRTCTVTGPASSCQIRLPGRDETCTLSTAPASGSTATCHKQVDVDPRGGGHGGPVGGPGNNGPWSDRLDGRYFRLDQGPALDICDSGASSYDLWLNRNGSYRDRIVRQLNAQRWNDLRRSDCAGTVVSDDGQCVTYVTARDNIRNYTNDYNRLRGVYHGDFNRLSRSDRDNLNRLYALSNRYRNDWNTNLSKLRTVCQDNTPPVVVINEAPAAPVTVTQSAPAPVYTAPSSGASGGSIPSGSVNTGGNSVAFTLAHNRAV